MVNSKCVRFGPLEVDLTHCPLWFSLTAGVGRHGADMVKTTPVCFSPDRSAPWSSGEGPERGGQSIAGSLVLDGPVMVLRHHVTPGRASHGRSL